MQTIKVYSEFLVKSYEEFIADVISEAEYLLFKKIFTTHILTSENNITNYQEELRRLDNDIYVTRFIERILEYKNTVELNRVVVVKLIKSIIVSSSDDININFRYLDNFLMKEQDNNDYDM